MNPLCIDIPSGDDALRRIGSVSVQRGLSAIRLPAPCYLARQHVQPDGGKTLLR